MEFLNIIKMRRSRYEITNRLPISEAELEKMLEECIKHAPSAFNSQSARVVLLVGGSHKLFWDLVLEKLRSMVPADHFVPTKDKIHSFSQGYGTILFLEDQTVVEELQEQYPLYKENFSVWSEQSNGMLQFVVWTALAERGIGASLQHYNPIADEEVFAAFD